MDLKKYFAAADIREIESIVKAIKSCDRKELRETAIGVLLSGEADNSDHTGVSRKDNDNIASKAWIIATLMHLKHKGYEIVKK